MRKRTQAREYALQILYQIDLANKDPKECLEDFWQAQEQTCDEKIKEFASFLVCGTLEHISVIDNFIKEYTTNWQLERMAAVDRNILRMATFELVFASDIPSKVSINEAVELAKKYSNLESGKFVNGILDKIKEKKNALG